MMAARRDRCDADPGGECTPRNGQEPPSARLGNVDPTKESVGFGKPRPLRSMLHD
jgi:hypothetical protein